MSKKAAKPHSGITQTQLASIGQDPLVAAVKRRATPHQWRKIVKRAHANGVTVAGFLSGGPRPLQERTRSSLTRQARHTVAAAYAPARRDLTDQEKQIKAIDEKRQHDNASYLDWLHGQSTKLIEDSRAASNATADKNREITQLTADSYKGLHDEAIAHVGAQDGTVSDLDQSKALDFSSEGARGVASVAALAVQGNDQAAARDEHMAATSANNFAVLAAQDAKRISDTWKGLSGIASDRAKLKLQQGADSAKEVARLLDQEITKAQSNSDRAIAASKLGVDQQKIAAGIARDKRNFKLAQSKFNLDVKKFHHQVHVDHAELGIKRGHEAEAADQFAQSQQLDWYKARHPKARGGKDGSHDLKHNNQYAFDTAYASITTGTRTRGAGKHSHTVAYDSAYVRHNRNYVIAQLIAHGFTRHTATLAVNAYISNGGSDPGNMNNYRHNPGNPNIKGADQITGRGS